MSEIICVTCRRPITSGDALRHGYGGVSHERDRCISILLAESDGAGAWQRKARDLLKLFEHAVSTFIDNPPPVIRVGEPAARFGDWINDARVVCADTREFLRLGVVTSDCKCTEIMQADETRHFRGCPMREKYPTHEAERAELKAQPDDALLAEAVVFLTGIDSGFTVESAETKILADKFKRIRDQAKENERVLLDMSNAWSSREAAPPGAVELKHEPPTVYEHELNLHRRAMASMDDPVSRAVFFLLAVAHQPVPADYVPAGAIQDRFEEIEGRAADLHKHILRVESDIAHGAGPVSEMLGIFINARGPLEQHQALQSLQRRLLVAPIAPRFVPVEWPDRPKVVVLCGSTRFSKAFADANLAETLKGNIILTVGNLMHSSDADTEACVRCRATDRAAPCVKGYSAHQFERLTSAWHKDTKKALDALHFKKIEMADEVFVLNVEACALCKKVRGVSNLCVHEHQQHGFLPYVGESTRNEIRHALTLKKRIRFLNRQGDIWSLLPGDVPSVDEIMKQMGLA